MRMVCCPVRWIAAAVLVQSTMLLAAADEAADLAAIRARSLQLQEAVTAGDAATMLQCWTEDADLVDVTGARLRPHEVLRAAIASGQRPTRRQAFHVLDSQLRFVGPHVALEDGVAEFLPADSEQAVMGRFTAVWQRHGDEWLLSALREYPAAETHGGPLEHIQWMQGQWSAPMGDETFDVDARFVGDGAAMVREFRIQNGQETTTTGVQILVWDPLQQVLRSWTTDRDGGFAEAAWHQVGDSWVARSQGQTPDGKPTSSLNVHHYDGQQWHIKSSRSLVDNQPQEDRTLVFTRRQTPQTVKRPGIDAP